MNDNAIVEEILQRQIELESDRLPYEPAWREIDERVNPLGEGGFTQAAKGGVRGTTIFDHTASTGLNRFQAAYGGMIIPRGERYQLVQSTSTSLNDFPAFQQWAEKATDLLFGARYRPIAGFETEAGMCIRSIGTYGNAPLWTDHRPGLGMFYKTLHLAEVFVDEDFTGRIDTVHRKFTRTARQARQMFGPDNLTPSIQKAIAENKLSQEFTFLHVIRPRAERDPGRFDFRRMAWESRYICVEDKAQLREGGYETMPIAFARYVTGPRERYGRSPAMQVLGSIRTVNEMVKTLLRAGHKAVDPPLLTPEDGVLSRIQTKPGGINVGGLGFDGSPMVVPLQTGGNLPLGMELLNNEREPIRDAFLETVFSLVLERRDRMTATEVLEHTRMVGMLMSPSASRGETEWLSPQTARELEILLDSGTIPPPPPEMREEGAQVKLIYDNPLTRAAKAEEALGFGRFIEMLTPAASIAGPEVYDVVNWQRAPRELAKSLAVRQAYLSTPDEVTAKGEARAQQQEVDNTLKQLALGAGAVKDLSAARGEETALGI